MFNIYIRLNYGIACTVTDFEGRQVRMRHGEEVLINRTLYNNYRKEMCKAQVSISNKKIVAEIPKYAFRFEKIEKKDTTNDNLQENQ